MSTAPSVVVGPHGLLTTQSYVPALAAVANAIYHATGVRMRRLPASPRVVLEELMEQ